MLAKNEMVNKPSMWIIFFLTATSSLAALAVLVEIPKTDVTQAYTLYKTLTIVYFLMSALMFVTMLRENVKMLIIVAVFQLVIGGYQIFFSVRAETRLRYNSESYLLDALWNMNPREIIFRIQKELKCCGITSHLDWRSQKAFFNASLPKSCCSVNRDCTGQSIHLYKEGCLDRFLRKMMWGHLFFFSSIISSFATNVFGALIFFLQGLKLSKFSLTAFLLKYTMNRKRSASDMQNNDIFGVTAVENRFASGSVYEEAKEKNKKADQNEEEIDFNKLITYTADLGLNDRAKVTGFLMVFHGILLLSPTYPFNTQNTKMAYSGYNIVMGLEGVFHSAVLMNSIYNYNLKNMFVGSLLLVVVSIINAIPLLVTNFQSTHTEEITKKYLWESIEEKDKMERLVYIQFMHQCCGVSNWTDWKVNKELNPNPNEKSIELHKSCCPTSALVTELCPFYVEFHRKPCTIPVMMFIELILKLAGPFYLLHEFNLILIFLMGVSLKEIYSFIGKRLYII